MLGTKTTFHSINKSSVLFFRIHLLKALKKDTLIEIAILSLLGH